MTAASSGADRAPVAWSWSSSALVAADWRRTDSSTMYAEILREDDDGQRVVRVAMMHVHDGTGVVVQLTGPPDQKATMQKLINEIRART